MKGTFKTKPATRKIAAMRDDVGERVLEARVRRGMSQQALAKQAGVDRKTINRIENGHFSPSIETLLRVCYVVDLTPSRLLKGIAL